MKVAAVIQARMTSTRLPGKALKTLCGEPMLLWVLSRVQRIELVDDVVVAIPDGPDHQPIATCLEAHPDITLVRGPEHDVLTRTLMAGKAVNADAIVRITSDCPMIDPDVCSSLVSAWRCSGARYGRLAFNSGFPLGFDTEVFRLEDLEKAASESSDPYEREHATPFLWRNPDRFPAIYIDANPNRRHWRLVVDTEDDFRLAEAIYERLGPDFRYLDLVRLFEKEPRLLAINSNVVQTEYLGLPKGK